MTADGRIRHKLLASGRYDEARHGHPSAYPGRYDIRGSHVDYWDDTGFTANGEFIDPDELHHGGIVLCHGV